MAICIGSGQAAPRMRLDLKKLLTPRFLKFCTVGASGVLVNLGFFYLFADVLRLYVHLASACAIEISILSNFAVNEMWTFRDRRKSSGARLPRALRFHAVSLAGGTIQWCIFAVVNALILRIFLDPPGDGTEIDFISRYVIHPIAVGKEKYFAQLAGIGVATMFNFYANVHWTWRKARSSTDA